MTAPEVAILTPCFGHAQFLGAMLESVRAQTFVSWECCVVIDGPDRQAMEVAQYYAALDPRIHWVMTNERRGLPAARNMAVKQTDAPWLLPFDADDLMDPDYVAVLRNSAVLHTEKFPVCYTAGRLLFPSGSTQVFTYPPYRPNFFTQELQIPGCSMHPRTLWETLGGWDEAWTYGAEDWHYWARGVARRIIEPVNCRIPLWSYRQHDGPRNSKIGAQFWHELKPKIDAVLAEAAL